MNDNKRRIQLKLLKVEQQKGLKEYYKLFRKNLAEIIHYWIKLEALYINYKSVSKMTKNIYSNVRLK